MAGKKPRKKQEVIKQSEDAAREYAAHAVDSDRWKHINASRWIIRLVSFFSCRSYN